MSTAGPIATTGDPDFSKTGELVDGENVEPKGDRAATRLWAAFVRSGAGK